jgi:hypothetical protein
MICPALCVCTPFTLSKRRHQSRCVDQFAGQACVFLGPVVLDLFNRFRRCGANRWNSPGRIGQKPVRSEPAVELWQTDAGQIRFRFGFLPGIRGVSQCFGGGADQRHLLLRNSRPQTAEQGP